MKNLKPSSPPRFSDLRKMVSILNSDIDRHNHIIRVMNPDNPAPLGLVDHGVATRKLIKSYARFYGLNNKYDGSGNLRGVV